MKRIRQLFTILLSVTIFSLQAQNTAGKLDDAGRISLNAFVSDQIEGLPPSADNILKNKLDQIITENGIAGDGLDPRFILTPNVIVLNKDITSTAPVMTALNLSVTFYIGDGIEGKKFSSYQVSVKGAGVNETKAYMNALNNIKPNDEGLKNFLEKGKTKIIEYYNTRCDLIIMEAKALETQNRYDEALAKLMAVPSVCTDCYKKVLAAAGPIYLKFRERDCKQKLNEASNLWASNQNEEGAAQVAEILSTIDPNATCAKDIKTLTDKVAARIKEINNRNWEFKFLEKDRIKAMRDVGVAYGNGQPKSITYLTRGWF